MNGSRCYDCADLLHEFHTEGVQLEVTDDGTISTVGAIVIVPNLKRLSVQYRPLSRARARFVLVC